MMSNFLLAFDNQADSATLTLGAWNASYPQANLKDYRVKKTARTSSAAEANTKLRFALAAPMHIGLIGLMAVNASIDAQYQVLLYSDSGFTTLQYDSGVLDLYPMGTVPYGTIPWGAPNWWTGKPLPAEIARFQRNIFHELTNWQYGQYGEIRVFDSTNSAGYLEAGRLFVGQAFRPARNASYGAALQLKSRTDRVRSVDGTPYYTARRPDFAVPFSFDWLTNDEGMRVLDLQAICDLYGEVLFAWDTADVAYRYRKSVFGRLAELDRLQFPLVNTLRTSFQVEGVL